MNSFLPLQDAPDARWWDDVHLPLGNGKLEVLLLSDGEALVGVHFPAGRSKSDPTAGAVHDRKALTEAAEQLEAYAAGELTDFDLALRPHGTAFQRDVWSALTTIPYGTTSTYGEVAEEIGRRGSGRAVGGAVGANPLGIVVPCHRVIGADGSLTGFGGGLDVKVALLGLEGVTPDPR